MLSSLVLTCLFLQVVSEPHGGLHGALQLCGPVPLGPGPGGRHAGRHRPEIPVPTLCRGNFVLSKILTTGATAKKPEN